jgi:hypothetical protein
VTPGGAARVDITRRYARLRFSFTFRRQKLGFQVATMTEAELRAKIRALMASGTLPSDRASSDS